MKEQEQNKTKHKSRRELIDEITELKTKLREDELREPQIFVTDVTPEALETGLAEQKERVAMLTDEGNLFDILSGMYSGGKQNLDVFLKGHAGGPLRVKRQSRVHNLNKIALSIGLAIQPGVLKGIADKDSRKFREKGLLARFLPYLPKSNIGTRDIRDRQTIPAKVKDRYFKGIKALLDIEPNRDQHEVEIPKLVTLTPEALSYWQTFSQDIEDQQGEGNQFESLQDFTGKLPGQALRIAALCHIAGKFDPNALSSLSALSTANKQIEPIGKEQMAAVISAGKKLIVHTQAAFDLMGDDPVIADAKYILSWIHVNAIRDTEDKDAHTAASKGKQNKLNPAWFIRQNALHKTPRFRNSRLERVTDALKILEQRHIISRKFELATRKPTYIYWVNPDVIARRSRAL